MVRQGVDMEKHLYVVVASVEIIKGEWETQSVEVEASGRVSAKFNSAEEFGDTTIYILAVYGPYERISDGQ